MSSSTLWLRGTVFDHKQVIGDDGFHYDLVYPYFLHSGDYLKRLLSHEFALQYRKHETPEPLETLSSPAAMVSFFNDTFASDFKDFDAAQAAEPLFGAALLDFYLKNDINRIQQTYPQPMVNTNEMARRLAVLKKNPQAVIRAYDDRFENMRNSTFNCAFDPRESSFGYSCSGSSVIFHPVETNQDILADDVWLLPGVFYRGAYMPVLEGVEVWLASFTSDMSRVEIGTTFAAGSEFKVRYHFIVDTRKNTGKTLHNFLRAFATIFGGTGAALSVTAGGKDIVDDDSLIPSIPGTQTSNFSWVRGTVHDHKQVTDIQGQQHPLIYPEFTRHFDLFLRDYLRGELPATFNEPVPADQAEPPLGNDAALIAYFNETFATDYSIETYKDAQFGPQALISRFDPQKDSELRPRSPLSDALFNNRLENFRRKPRSVLEAFDKRFANLVVGQHYAALNAADSTLGFGSAGDAIFKLSNQGAEQKADCVWLVPGLADEYTEFPALDGVHTWWVMLSADKKTARVGVQPKSMEAGWTFHKIVVDTERNSGKLVHQLIQGLAGTKEVEVYREGELMLDDDQPVGEYQRPMGSAWMRGTIDSYKEVHSDNRKDYRLAQPKFLNSSEFLYAMLSRGDYPDFPGLQGETGGDRYFQDDQAVAQFIQSHYGYPIEDQQLHKPIQGNSEWADYFNKDSEALDHLRSELDPVLYDRLLFLLQTNPDMVFNAYDSRFANLRVGRDLASLDPADSTLRYSCAGAVVFQLQNPPASTLSRSATSRAEVRSGDVSATNIHLVPGLFDESKTAPALSGIEVWTVSTSADKTIAQVGVGALGGTDTFKIIVDTTRNTAESIYKLIQGKVKEVTQVHLHGSELNNDASIVTPAANASPGNVSANYAGVMNRVIHIDERTGQGALRLSLASLLMHGREPVYDVCLTSDLIEPVLNFMPHGTWHISGTHQHFKFELRGVPLPGAVPLDLDIEMDGTGLARGAGLVVDALAFVKAKRDLAALLDKQDTLTEAELDKLTQAERDELSKKGSFKSHETEDRCVALIAKNGVAHVFECSGGGESGTDSKVFLKSLVFPSGRSLEFTWEDRKSQPRLVGVKEGATDLLVATWAADKAGVHRIKSLVVFPNTDEQFTGSITYEENAIIVSFKGAGIDADELEYQIDTLNKRINRVDAKAHYDILHTFDRTVRIDAELIAYNELEQVKSYTMKPASNWVGTAGGGYEPLVANYNYAGDRVTVVYTLGNTKPNEIERRIYEFNASGIKAITSIANGQTTTETREVAIDKALMTATVTTSIKAGAAEAETTLQKYDARGNLIFLQEGDQVSEWTYFNDYDQYTVSLTPERVSTANVGNWPATWAPVLADYANPIGWGFLIFGDSGLTWHTVTHTKVSTAPTGSNYAKTSFNLPIDINYPGSAEGVSPHVESELVYRKSGESKHVQQLTYFGYEKFTPVKHPGLSRTHVVVPSVKLTVVQPAYEEVDVSAAQLIVAQAAAKAYIDNLNARIADKKASDEDRDASRTALADLNTLLDAQSKFNRTGYKLKTPYQSDTMQVEALAYDNVVSSAGFGQVKAITTYWLDDKGKKKEASTVSTTFEFSSDSAKHTITTKTVVKTADPLEVSSSRTCSSLSGRLCQSTDTEGMSTAHEYDNRGKVTRTTITSGAETLSDTLFHVDVVEKGKRNYVTQDVLSKAAIWMESSFSGLIQRRAEAKDGETWLEMGSSKCDSRGRPSHTIEHDYDSAGKRISTLETLYNYKDALHTCEITYALKDGKGVSLDSQTVTWMRNNHTTRMACGTFAYEQSFAAGERTLTTTSGLGEKANGRLKVQTAFDRFGKPLSVKSYRVKAGVETELSAIVTDYGVDGLPIGKTGTSGGTSFATTYEYDHFGRLVKQNDNGRLIRNSYSGNGLSSAAAEAKLVSITEATEGTEATESSVTLGTQQVDVLGRITSRTINGTQQAFVFKGASNWGSTAKLEKPGAIKGYKAEIDSTACIYTETCPVQATQTGNGSDTLTTSSTYSYRGRLLSITDVAGYTTSYVYDAFGRVKETASAACKTTLTYRDDGHVQQETVQDLLGGHSMTTVYDYDLTGNETSRTFSLDGLATHKLTRELALDGRLTKSVLSLDDQEHSSDQYQYNSQGRLLKWNGTNKAFLYSSTPVNEQTFTYDILGNVVQTQPTQVKSATDTYQWSPVINREFDPDKPGLLKKHSSDVISSDAQGRWIYNGVSYYANGKVKRVDYTAINYTGMELGYDDLGRVRGMYLVGGNNVPYGAQFHYRGGSVYARSSIMGGERHDQTLLNDSKGCYVHHSRIRNSVDKTDASETSFELRDSAGTVFATVNRSKVVTYHTYSPYGIGGNSSWLGFKGEAKLLDGTYYLGSERICNPEYMSFQSPDSWYPFGPVGAVSYAYCAGDPVNFHDPSGHREVAHYTYVSTYPLMYTREFRLGLAVAGLLLAPFTGASSLLVSLSVTGLALVASAFEIASTALEESDPKLSETLGYVGLGLGIASAVGAFGASKLAARGVGRVAAGAGEQYRAHYFSNVNQYVPVMPRGTRSTHWHQISMPSPTYGGGVRHIWGADTSITGGQVMTPLRQIARRGSTSDVHILTGVHGRRDGNNWLDAVTPTGRPTAVRDPALNEFDFYYRDNGDYGALDAFDQEPSVQQALNKRQIFVTDIRSMFASDLNAIEKGSGHYIHAYCYGINDERLLYNYTLPPATSYASAPPYYGANPMPQHVFYNPNYQHMVYT
ncbi:MAG: RHS repeat-associated core domain-containing protein [Pseudomonas sp.]|uniref:RHS repeat-associated core domain-containing protein n=1 Tax=Pseudomonas sp. TaxID=306 RepID=UPI003D14F98A